MLNLQVTVLFIYHRATKKFCDGKTVKKQALCWFPRSENSILVLWGLGALAFERPVHFTSDISVYSSPYD
jgi:hypothetical protein